MYIFQCECRLSVWQTWNQLNIICISYCGQIKQDTEKTTAVATVVAAVDLARVREPVAGFTERTTKETLATIHVQSIQDQVAYNDVSQSQLYHFIPDLFTFTLPVTR